jgi:hypothetical protein
MNHRTSTIKALCAFGVSLLAACGGRSETIEGGSTGGTSVASGASTSVGGATSGGSTTVEQGGTASAGTPGAGAAGGCFAGCPDIACGSGAMLVTEPGTCCPVCETACSHVTCPGMTCPGGYQQQMNPGDCCPICVPIPTMDCATGMMSYEQERAQLADKYAFGCKTAADCVAVAPSNMCEGGCGYAAISNAALNDFITNLGNAAPMDCVNCPSQPTPRCAPPPLPYCDQGQCKIPI